MRARKKAAHRPRRLVYNDDGDTTSQWDPNTGVEGFYAYHVDKLVGTPVDSYQWCMMWNIGSQAPGKARYWETQKYGKSFHPTMPDPTPLIIQFWRKHGIEVVGGILMVAPLLTLFAKPFETKGKTLEDIETER